MHGLFLAQAGLDRLQLKPEHMLRLDNKTFVPSAGQGTIVVECLSENVKLIDRLRPLNKTDVEYASTVERSCMAALGANCRSAVGVYATHDEQNENMMSVQAVVLSADGDQRLHKYLHFNSIHEYAADMGEKLAADLNKSGARHLLESAEQVD